MKVRIFCLLACVYLAFAEIEPPWADGKIMWETARALIDKQTLQLDIGGPSFFFTFRDGKKYGLYPLGNVITLLPTYLAEKALTALPKAPVALLRVYMPHVAPSLLAAAACALFFALAQREGARRRVALWLSLALGLQTLLVIYARVPWSEALQTLLLLLLFERASALAVTPTLLGGVVAGLVCGWLVNTKLYNLLPVAVAAIYVVWRGRALGRPLWRAVGAATAVFVPLGFAMLANNRVKTGTWFDTGYSTAGGELWTAAGYDALFGYLVSPGRSFLVYSPILLLGLLGLPAYFRRDRGRGLLLVGLCLSLFLPYLKFRSWYGGQCWGPRYLVPLTPLLLLPAAPWMQSVFDKGIKRLALAGIALLSATSQAVQVLGCAFYWDHYIRIAQNLRAPGTDEALAYVATVFIPELSPVPGHLWMLKHKLWGGDLAADMPWRRILTRVPPNLAAIFDPIPIDVWFPTWFRSAGAAPTWAAVMLALFAAGVGWAAWGMRQRLREPESQRA